MASAPPMDPRTARLVSRYGVRPSRRDGSDHFHAGTDISTGVRGAAVYAVKEGTVELISEETNPRGMTGYGNAVVIRHGNKFTLYAHLSRVLVSERQEVRAGQQIGVMGNTTNGQFSPLPGQAVADWERAARARGYRSGPMVPHLHLEVRTARPDGSSPFPGPYPRSADAALFNIDPQVWMRSHGMIFTRHGGIEVAAGSSADRARSIWEPSVSSVAGLLGFGQYQPVEFERDVKWGLSPLEWGAVSAAISATLLALFVAARRRMRPNRRRYRRLV